MGDSPRVILTRLFWVHTDVSDTDRKAGMDPANLLCKIPVDLPSELVQTLVAADAVRVEQAGALRRRLRFDVFYGVAAMVHSRAVALKQRRACLLLTPGGT